MSRDAPPWWVGLTEAVAELDCGGATHRVRWASGALSTDDHDDAKAEETLEALGGEAPRCIEILRAWRRHAATPELITLGRRPGEAELGLRDAPVLDKAAILAPYRRRGVSPASLRQAEARMHRREELGLLLALPAPLIDRLVLTVLASCADRWDDEALRENHGLRIGAALSARATPALRRFAQKLGDGPVEVGVSPVHPDRLGPLVAARLERGQPVVISAELPVSWLPTVWGRGVSEPDGEFVLAVTGGTDDGLELEVFVAEWESSGAMAWEAVPVPARIVFDPADGRRQVIRR